MNKIKKQERLAKLKEKQKKELQKQKNPYDNDFCAICDMECGECGYCAEHCECEE